MKFRIFVVAAFAICCSSCIKTDTSIGGNLLPDNLKYSVHAPGDILLTDFEMSMIDTLSGLSDQWFSIGTIRDEELGLMSRKATFTLVPLVQGDGWDFGTNPQVRQFHLEMALDSISVSDLSQQYVLQNLHVYELSKALDLKKDFNCAGDAEHGTVKINKSFFLNGTDSLSFDFTNAFAEKYFTITPEELKDMDKYLKRFPGIYLETPEPAGIGGRINTYEFQLGYNSTYKYITGNFAKLYFHSTYDGEEKDTTFYFYIGATEFKDVDTLLQDYSTGNFEQYALTYVQSESSSQRIGHAADMKVLTIEGGLGPKPHIKASTLKKLATEAIIADGNDPNRAVINSASICFYFDFPSDYRTMYKYPTVLSPLCHFKSDSSAYMVNITDFSNENENIGGINRSIFTYAPNITYHLQEIMKCDDAELAKGDRDLWMMTMAYESYTNTTNDSEMAEYYQALAYQSYYNSMYSSGSYGGYTDYYSYIAAAQYANGSVYTSDELNADKVRFYNAKMIGPAGDKSRSPRLKLVYSVPLK